MSGGKLVAYNGKVSWKFYSNLGRLKKKKQKEKKVRMKLFLDIPYFVYFKIRIKLIWILNQVDNLFFLIFFFQNIETMEEINYIKFYEEVKWM